MNQNEKVKDAMNRILECEPDTPLEAVQKEIGVLADATVFSDQPTVKSALQKLNDASHPFAPNVVNGEEVAVSPMYKDYIHQYVRLLSELLGIELEN